VNYVQGQATTHPFEYGGNTPAAYLERKLRVEVLPHYYAPSTRQQTLQTIVTPLLTIEAEMELQSPRFKPAALQEFEERGFVRRNRWGK
jgi:hypothetical protein